MCWIKLHLKFSFTLYILFWVPLIFPIYFAILSTSEQVKVESSWNVMAHGDAREGKWRGNWRMECVDSTLHTTLEYGVSSITTADEHTLAVSSRLNWCPRRFKKTRPFRRNIKSGFCACAITFQTQSTIRFKGLIEFLRTQHICHNIDLYHINT